jgi:hypothetical protein
MWDKEAKLNALAEVIEGKIIDDSARVEVCIKGTEVGFPATIEAIRSGFPFGCSLFIETDVLNEHQGNDPNAFALTINPKVVTGFWAMFSRILLVDHTLKPLGDKKFDATYIASTTDNAQALRFITYPSMMDRIMLLSKYSGFTELHVRAGHGVVLVQPQSVEKIEVDTVRESFKLLGEMAQVVFEAF